MVHFISKQSGSYYVDYLMLSTPAHQMLELCPSAHAWYVHTVFGISIFRMCTSVRMYEKVQQFEKKKTRAFYSCGQEESFQFHFICWRFGMLSRFEQKPRKKNFANRKWNEKPLREKRTKETKIIIISRKIKK